jgi:hypothetical protein
MRGTFIIICSLVYVLKIIPERTVIIYYVIKIKIMHAHFIIISCA